MTPQEVLGLPAGPFDRSALKRAYAAALRLHRPDEDPVGFRRVRDAYEALSAWLDRAGAAVPETGPAPWGDAAAEEEATPPEEPDGGESPAPASPPRSTDGPELDSRRGVPWEAPPTRAPLATDVPWTAELVLGAWLRGEISLALGGVESLGREGQVEEVETLAQRLIEEPAALDRADFPAFAVAVAKATALVRRDVAQALADLAWRRSTPSERRWFDLFAFDLRRHAARHVAPWPVAAKRTLLRIAAGVPCPPPPRPHEWEEALSRIRALPSSSPTLAWLEAEAPEVLKASGARRVPRRPKPLRTRDPKRLFVLFLIAPIVSLLSTALRTPTSGSSAGRDSIYDPVELKVLLDRSEAQARRDAGSGEEEEAQILLTLESLRTVPPPSVENIRSTLADLEKRSSFAPAYQRSAGIRYLYRAIKERLPPIAAAPEAPTPETPHDR